MAALRAKYPSRHRARRVNRFQPIPGSRLFRDYCYRCDEAMRISANQVEAALCGNLSECEECRVPRPGASNEFNRTPIQHDEDPGVVWKG